jgi:WD40 repeat protein
MTEDRIPHPRSPSDDELAGLLRGAVEQVCAEPAPPPSVARALERARLLDKRPTPAVPVSRWRVLASAGLAAAMVLSIGLYYWARTAERATEPVQNVADRLAKSETPRTQLGDQAGDKERLGRVQPGGRNVTYSIPARPVAFATAGRFLATTGPDRPIRLGASVEGADKQGSIIHVWDVAHGNKDRLLKPGVNPFASGPNWGRGPWLTVLALSPDGRRLALSGDGNVRVWDIVSGTELYHKSGSALSLLFSPDGKTLAVQQPEGGGGGIIHLWQSATGKEIGHVKGQGSTLPSVAFSPNGKRLASASGKQLCIWDVASGKALRSFPQGHKDTVAALVISPDGKRLSSSGSEGTIRIWDVAQGKELHRMFLPHRAGVADWATTLAFSPDGKTLAAGGNSGIHLWDTATGRDLRTFAPESGGAAFLAFSPDGKTLASVPAPYSTTIPDNGKLGRINLGDLGTLEVYPTVFLWEVATGRQRFRFGTEQTAMPSGPGLWRGTTTGLGWRIVPGRKGEHLSPTALQHLWDDLASENAAAAYGAACTLAAIPEDTVPFFAEKLHPVAPVSKERLDRLLTDLGSDRFAVRERATHELAKLRELAVDALHQAQAAGVSLELRRRAEKLLERLQSPDAQAGRLGGARAVEVLETIASPAARQVLRRLASGAPVAWLTQDAGDALGRLGGSGH